MSIVMDSFRLSELIASINWNVNDEIYYIFLAFDKSEAYLNLKINQIRRNQLILNYFKFSF